MSKIKAVMVYISSIYNYLARALRKDLLPDTIFPSSYNAESAAHHLQD